MTPASCAGSSFRLLINRVWARAVMTTPRSRSRPMSAGEGESFALSTKGSSTAAAAACSINAVTVLSVFPAMLLLMRVRTA